MEENQSKGLAIAALVLGILSFITFGGCCLLGVISIIFAIVVLVKHKGGKVMAIIGMILSAISVLYMAISLIMFIPLKDSYMDFALNMDAYIEEYEEEGTYPEFIEKLAERQGGSEEKKEQTKKMMMDMFKSISQSVGVAQNDDDMEDVEDEVD